MATGHRTTVSVVIPLYNKVDHIAKAIEGALGQERVPDEIIVIDDGSTDGSDVVALRYASRVRYVRQDNMGPGASRNRGMELASSDLVAFLDADDRWLPSKLRLQVDFMNAHPNIHWCGTNYWIVSNGVDERRTRTPPGGAKNEEGNWVITDWFSASARQEIAFQASGIVIRKHLIQSVGGFDESILSGQDFDYWVRVAEQSPRCGYYTAPCYSYTTDAAESITSLGREKFEGKIPMLSRLVTRSMEPSRPEAYGVLIRAVCDKVIRSAIVNGYPDVVRALLHVFPARWRDKRYLRYRILSHVPGPILRRAGQLFGRGTSHKSPGGSGET